MSEKTETVKSSCRRCAHSTWHKILCETTERGGEEYDFFASYTIVECAGCNNKCFRYVFRDIENSYPDNGGWEVPEVTNVYPNPNVDQNELNVWIAVPNLAGEIYREASLAIRENALILAGLGLRGTIEAICNDRSITERNLELRITKLETQGLISAKDADRLHAIRFLGNDAAHEIKKPTRDQIVVAQKIINHLIQSVYLLELEVEGKLETIIQRVDELKRIVIERLKSFQSEDEVPLVKILGKDARRLGGSAQQLENQLISDINSGSFPLLKIGKIAVYAGSKSPLQHFVLT